MRLWYYRDIYDEIAGSRQYTMNGEPLPIPISELLAYCEMFGIRRLEEREKLLRMVRAMDRAYLDVIREQAQKRDKPKTGKPVK